MSRPPRIANWLPWEQSTVYFITCVAQRKRVLDNDDTWRICRDIFNKLDRWTILAAISMPDHLHLLTSPVADRDASVRIYEMVQTLVQRRILELSAVCVIRHEQNLAMARRMFRSLA
jgi:REP element-mobilizing transposase RayT